MPKALVQDRREYTIRWYSGDAVRRLSAKVDDFVSRMEATPPSVKVQDDFANKHPASNR
jgi:hypothetical protein